MRLSRIQVWNFRSFRCDIDGDEWSPLRHGSATAAVDICLAPGVNYLSGPNNVGKSNLLRAVGLALDPRLQFDPSVDRPLGLKWDQRFGSTVILLDFEAARESSLKEGRLLKKLDQLEERFPWFQQPSNANQGIVRLWVEFGADGHRFASFMAPGDDDDTLLRQRNRLVGGKGGQELRQRALDDFYGLVRYVDVKSGEDLQSLLQRGFKDVLKSAISDEQAKAMQAAEAARERYRDALGQMLRPIARHVRDRIRPYVRDVEEIDLIADVPAVEEALAVARVHVTDSVQTSLEHKGTGVRGAMLLLLLSFIADSSKTGVIFGIEEPEAFLHPDAHRALGEGLARFTRREDVTLLVTTHSPFLFRADGDPRNTVFRVTKDADGRSSVAKAAPEAARADLLGSQVLSSALEKVESVPSSTTLILVVEGETDAKYIQLASRILGISLSGIHIAWQRGVLAVFMQSLALAAQHAPARRVVALFDTDPSGKEYYDLLGTRLGWKKRTDEGLQVLTYEKWLPSDGGPVEAEDLFPDAVLKRFLAEPGNDRYCTGTRLIKKQNRWHYDLDTDGKKAFVKWLETSGTVEIFEPWRPVLSHLAGLAKNAGAK